MKVVGKGLSILSFGVVVADNYSKYKDDTQKVVVGTAVDTVFNSGAAAAAMAISAPLIPPIGLIAGTLAGVGLSYFANKKFGKPPKSALDITKDQIDKGVDTAVKAAKKIGNKISKWFK